MHTAPQWIVELDAAQGRATLVAAGAASRVEFAHRAGAADPLAAARAAAGTAAPPPGATVVVLLGDPRVVTARLRDERPPAAADRAAVVEARLRELAMVAPAEELRAASVDLAGDTGWNAVVVGAPAALCAPFDTATTGGATFVTSAEVGLAALADPGRLDAVLDLRVDPARLVVVERGTWRGARRFKLPLVVLGTGPSPMAGIEGLDASGMVGAEVARALRAIGGPDGAAVDRLALLGAPAALRERTATLATAAGAREAVCLDDGGDGAADGALAVAVAERLATLGLPFLLAPAPADPLARLRRAAPRLVGFGAAALGVALLAFDRFGPPAARRQALADAAARGAELAAEVEDLEAALARPAIVADREAILAELRRPEQSVSRLLASVAAACGGAVALDAIELSASGRLTLRGEVRGDAPMAAFASLDRGLAGLPGLGPGEGGVGAASGPDSAAPGTERRLTWRAWLDRRLP